MPLASHSGLAVPPQRLPSRPRFGGVKFRLSAALLALVLIPVAALAAAPKPGEPAPPIGVQSPSGKPVSLASLRGKAVYINFFASWCGPCNDEAPTIAALRKKYGPRGLVVLGIDTLDVPGQADAFQKKYAGPFDLIGLDDNGHVEQRSYGGVGLPLHVFIDRKGIVRTYLPGEITPAQIEAGIQSALK